MGERNARVRAILWFPGVPPPQETVQAATGQYRSFPFMAAHRDPLASHRLDSWKEIAAFFGNKSLDSPFMMC